MIKFELASRVSHTIDLHLKDGVVIAILQNDFIKVAWLGLDFVSVIHVDFLSDK